jgi:hypothetical protein
MDPISKRNAQKVEKFIDEITQEDPCRNCAHSKRVGDYKLAARGYPWLCRRTETQGKPSGCEWKTTDPAVERLYQMLDMEQEMRLFQQREWR